MDIIKSSRHSKISGDFGETLVLYQLSKYGFECAKVDHTGIDLIARNPNNERPMGISVKTRTRSSGTEKEYVKLVQDDFPKIKAACDAFGCDPYIAFVVDAADTIRVFIVSFEHYLAEYFPSFSGGWGMSDKHFDRYNSDKKVIMFEHSTKTINWFSIAPDANS